MLDLCVGRDATIMFESSHPRPDVADAALKRLPKLDKSKLITSNFDTLEEKFDTPGQSQFYSDLRKRVRDQILRTPGTSPLPLLLSLLPLC